MQRVATAAAGYRAKGYRAEIDKVDGRQSKFYECQLTPPRPSLLPIKCRRRRACKGWGCREEKVLQKETSPGSSETPSCAPRRINVGIICCLCTSSTGRSHTIPRTVCSSELSPLTHHFLLSPRQRPALRAPRGTHGAAPPLALPRHPPAAPHLPADGLAAASSF